MAKGDSKKAQNQINYQGGTAQNNLNNLWGQNTDRTTNFQNLYQPAVQQNQENYNNVMGSYQNFLNNQPNSGAALSQFLGPAYQPSAANQPSGSGGGGYESGKYGGGAMDMGALGPAIAGYKNFAQSGGFSPEDIQSIRARSIAPIRGIYENTRREIQRQEGLRGTGYSPNTAAALAKSARDMNYATSDATTNAEAAIAQLVQQGKLAGLGGLSQTGLGAWGQGLQGRGLDLQGYLQGRGLDLQSRGQDLNAILGSGQQQLGGLSGMGNLYGTTPGLANMFGNQVLQSGAQGIQLGGLQNQLGLGLIGNQIDKSRIPGNFQSGLGNLGSGLGALGSIGKGLLGLFSGGIGGVGGGSGGGNDPYAEYQE